MKKTPSIIDTYYKSLGTKIFRDTTALPFADGGPLNDRNIHGDLLPSVYASALGRYYGNGGQMKPDYSLPEDSFQQGGNGLKNSVYASSMGQYPAPYAEGGPLNGDPGPKPKFKPQPKPLVITDPKEYAFRKAAYDDSLWLYQHNQRNPMLRKPNNYRNNGNWFHDLLAWSGNETISNKKNFTLTPEQFKKGHLRQIDKNAIARFANNTGITTVGNALLDGHVSTKNSFKTREEYDLTTAAEDLKNRYSPIRQKYPLIPWNDPIAYVGKTAKYTDNIKQAGDYLSQIETRYKKPIQPVLFKEEITPIRKTYPPVIKKPVTYVNPPVKEIIPTEQPQTPIQDNYPPPPPIAEGFPPGPPPPPPFNGVEPFIQGDPIPEYATPDPGAEFVPDTERYIDWNGNSIGFNGIRFRKPGHGGDLIKKGSRHYLHYPSIETRHSADIVPEDTEEFAQGGMMNQYPGGGPIYTYAKRPGSYYQKDDSGQWYISNKGTGGQYVPVDDPSGQRTAALNKGAVVTMANPTADKYSNVVPSYGKSPMVASVKGRTEAERKQVDDAIYIQKMQDKMKKDFAIQKDDFPQHEQPLDMMDWLWGAAAGAPMAFKSLGQLAALKLPYTGVSLGTAAQAAGVAHGSTQIPNRIEDWQKVQAGKMDYRDALLNTVLTGSEFLGSKSAYDDIANAVKRINSPLTTAGTGKTLITANAPKTVVGTLDDFEDFTGASVPIGSNKNTAVDVSDKAHAIDLEAWEKAKGNAEYNDWRFIIPEQEQEFLASRYAKEFADKYNVPIENLNSYDVALYGKLKEAENLPTRQVGPASEKLFDKEKELHNSFMEQQKPNLDLNINDELVVDAYTRGYDAKINSRGNIEGANFYQDELAPTLEQIILKNKLQKPTTLVRGSKDFDIADTSSVMRNGEAVNNLKFSQLQEGDIFAPNSFISTRISDIDLNDAQTPLSNFTLQPGNLDYIINAPAGQSYLYPNASNIHNYVGELEAVLPKNLQYKLDKVVSDADRGYIPSASDVKPGVRYGLGDKAFTRVQNKYLPFVKALDKVEQSKWDQATKDYITTSQRLSKDAYQRLIDSHNKTHQPTVPKYHFSIANPYRLGGKLNKNYYF